MMPPVAEVVPHTGKMLFLDRVIDYRDQTLTAELTIREDNPFVHDGCVGAWIALEFMAQAIAAFAGCEARQRDEKPKIGFFIGSRQFSCNTPRLPVGSCVQVTIVEQFKDGSGLGSFTGTVSGVGISATAMLTVYQPDNVQQFLLMRRP